MTSYPSPCTQGEGWGEGLLPFFATSTFELGCAIAPHPDPLPEYR